MTDRVLSDKQKAFLSALSNAAQGDLRKAMDIAGYSKNTDVKEVLSSLTDEIIEISKQLLAANSIKAAFKLTDVLDRPAALGSDKIISASKEILDRAGVIKKEAQNDGVQLAAVVLLPAKEEIIKAMQGE